MGLHLKNFMKIKAQDTPDKILNFYGLSIGLEWGVGWGGTDIKCDSRISRKINITQIFESCWFVRDFTVARSLGEQQKHSSLLGTS